MSIPSTTTTMNDYDAVPYSSYPYSQTKPEHLYTLAKLFGLAAPDFSKSKILELGCASGGNIIPLALNYPDCSITGVDLSAVQITVGQQQIEALGLKNIQLKHLSIMDIEPSFGKFDYIIVHGILSWVPVEVQTKIFDICKQNLSETGVAYVSYNTLPGWNMVQSIRDMMLYHTKHLKTPAEKAAQARLLLTFLKDNVQDQDGPYGKLLAQEVALLAQVDDHYLLHDHLEQENKAFYFHEIIEQANKNQLQYLSDTNIASMFVGNHSQTIIEKFQVISNDMVRTEQYLDFLTNRRFKASLFCHANIPLNRNLRPEQIESFFLTTTLAPKAPIQDLVLDTSKEYEFSDAQGRSIRSNNPAIINMLLILQEHQKPILATDLMKKVLQRLKGTSFNVDVLRTEMLTTALRLVLADTVHLHSCAGHYTTSLAEKPKVSELVRYQVTKGSQGAWITSQLHTKSNIDIFAKHLLSYLDGENTVERLTDKMMAHFESKELNMHLDGVVITDATQLKASLGQAISNFLKNIAPQGLLVE